MDMHSSDNKRPSCDFADERDTLDCNVDALQVQVGGALTHINVPNRKEEGAEEQNFVAETELIATLTRSDWRQCIEANENTSFCIPFSIRTLKRKHGPADPLPGIGELHHCVASTSPIDLENLFKAHAIDDPSRNHLKPDPQQNTGSIDGNSSNALLQPLVVKDYLEGFALDEEEQYSSVLESPLEMLTLLDWESGAVLSYKYADQYLISSALQAADPTLSSDDIDVYVEEVESLAKQGATRAIDMGRKILGEGAEIITVSHVALRCGMERWGMCWGKPLCSSHYGLGVGVECRINFKVCEGAAHITCDWCGGIPLKKQGKVMMDELVVESEKWEAHAYFRLKTEQATCPAWLPSFPRNYNSNKYEILPHHEDFMTQISEACATIWEWKSGNFLGPIPLPVGMPVGDQITCVSCSSSHLVVCTSLGRVYTRGNGLEGQLGHGSLSVSAQLSCVEWFKGKQISSVSAARDATGGHTLCLDKGLGVVYSFGSGLVCGRGSTKPQMTPERVEGGLKDKKILSCTGGGGFSAVVCTDGSVWTWGCWARGRLGLGLPTGSAMTSKKKRRRFPRYRLTPQQVKELPHCKAIAVGSGGWHALALSENGCLYSWGHGSGGKLGTGAEIDLWSPECVFFKDGRGDDSVFVSVAAGDDSSLAIDTSGSVWIWGGGDERLNGRSGGFVSSSVLSYRIPWRVQGIDDYNISNATLGKHYLALLDKHETLLVTEPESCVPLEPSPEYMAELSGCNVLTTACGGGTMVALVSTGNAVGLDFSRLLELAQLNATTAIPISQQSNSDDDSTIRNVQEVGGGARPDVLLVGNGGSIHAHKLMLSMRSPVLRDLINREYCAGIAEEIILPSLSFPVMQAMVNWIYTGRLSIKCESVDIPELASAAEEYSLPDLLWAILGHRDQDVGANETNQLASSLAHAIGDPSYSDVRFIPNDGRPVSAHRFVLESRSSYFSAMFESGMKESAGERPIDIVVPDSRSSLVRMLFWIYTGCLAPGRPEDRLEDLAAADRYHLLDMKRLCQSALSKQITLHLVRSMLSSSLVLQAHSLCESCLNFAVARFGRIVEKDSQFLTFLKSESDISAAINTAIKLMEGYEKQVTAAAQHRRERHNAFTIPGIEFDSPFTLGVIVLVIVTGVVYNQMERIHAIGAVVPVLNAILVCAVMYWGYKNIASDNNNTSADESSRIKRVVVHKKKMTGEDG